MAWRGRRGVRGCTPTPAFRRVAGRCEVATGVKSSQESRRNGLRPEARRQPERICTAHTYTRSGPARRTRSSEKSLREREEEAPGQDPAPLSTPLDSSDHFFDLEARVRASPRARSFRVGPLAPAYAAQRTKRARGVLRLHPVLALPPLRLALTAPSDRRRAFVQETPARHPRLVLSFVLSFTDGTMLSSPRRDVQTRGAQTRTRGASKKICVQTRHRTRTCFRSRPLNTWRPRA